MLRPGFNKQNQGDKNFKNIYPKTERLKNDKRTKRIGEIVCQ